MKTIWQSNLAGTKNRAIFPIIELKSRVKCVLCAVITGNLNEALEARLPHEAELASSLCRAFCTSRLLAQTTRFYVILN